MMLGVAAADEDSGPTVTINTHGLVLFQECAGIWLIRGSADGLVHAAEDRLVWLLPLLERSPADVSAALPQVPVAETPIPALVRFALTAWGEHWPALAIGWLESGWPTGDLLDVLAEMKDNPKLPQALRHRALRLWRDADGDSRASPE